MRILSPPQDAAAAKAHRSQLNVYDPPNDCISVPPKYNSWGFFCDFFKGWWIAAAGVRCQPGRSGWTSCAAAATR